MFTYSFENLIVWKESKELAISIYSSTKTFPAEEKFGLVSQLRRAAISICSNIAEGSGRKHPKGQAHFNNMAFGSLMEVLSETLISMEFGWIPQQEVLEVRKKIEGVSLKLYKLCKACYERT